MLLRKGIHIELANIWWNIIIWQKEKEFYTSLNMKNITDVDYRSAKRVYKELNRKTLGEYNDLYVHRDTLLLADIF